MDVDSAQEDFSTFLTPALRQALLLPPTQGPTTRAQAARQQAAVETSHVDWTNLPDLAIPGSVLYDIQTKHPTLESYQNKYGFLVDHHPVLKHISTGNLPSFLLFAEEVIASLACVASILYPTEYFPASYSYLIRYLEEQSKSKDLFLPHTLGQALADMIHICTHLQFPESPQVLQLCRDVQAIVADRLRQSTHPTLRAMGSVYRSIEVDPYDDEEDQPLPSEMEMDGKTIPITRVPAHRPLN